MVGRTLSHYRVVERLGAGGMGEVYRAHDEKLDRDVALKVLPEAALADETARARFRKEAHALSRLSHPHIAHLLDFDSEDGVDFLVMELVTGPSLAEKLREGPLPEKDVLRLGAQLARGLQAAHEQGVIHRDLKPSNLHFTSDGLLKILDFGLARFLQPKTTPPGHSTATETAAGAIVGSPPYMAPEQLLGKPPDTRTDLYSVGAVLYELATGQRPFGERTGVALTDAILHEAPPPPRTQLSSLSPGLEAIVLKALDKDPELRHQTAKDLLVDLERLHLQSGSRSSGSGPVASPAHRGQPSRSRRVRLAGLSAVAALLAGLGWILWPPPLPRIGETRPLRVDVGPSFQWATWATDGVRAYYVARKAGEHRLYQVALSGGEPAEIPTPFADALEVYGYLHRRSSLLVLGGPSGEFGRVKVWLLPLPGGAPRPVGDLAANFVAVSPDEEQLALSLWEQDGSRIVVVRLDNPAAPPLAEVPVPVSGPSGRAFALRWSPDGERLRFTAGAPRPGDPGSWVWEMSMAGGQPRPLWPGQGGAWTEDGRHFVFERQAWAARRWDLYVAPDGTWLPWLRGEPGPLTNGPITFREVRTLGDGSRLLGFGELQRGELQRFNRASGAFERHLGGDSRGMMSRSPDDQWIAWVSYPEGTLWRSRPDGSEPLQLTDGPDSALRPVWSPDGAHVAFIGVSWDWSLRMVPADGGPVETLAEPEPDWGYVDPCWLPDGALLFSRGDGRRPGLLSLDPATRAITPVEGAQDLLYPRCGPQGQLLAYRPAVGSRPPSRMVHWPERGGWEEVGLVSFGDLAWTRDGRSVCGHDRPGNRIACHSFDTGRVETLVEIGDEPLLNWPFVPWMGLDAVDNPLVVFDRSTRDLYALDWAAP